MIPTYSPPRGLLLATSVDFHMATDWTAPGLVEALILGKDGAMPRHGKYPDEWWERAVRMILDHGHEYGSQ